MSWEASAKAAQQSVHDSIPSKWKIAPEILSAKPSNVSRLIEDKGLLDAKQLDITSKDATEVLSLIQSGKLTATEVCEAFCARAALAHQLVCPFCRHKQFSEPESMLTVLLDKLSYQLLPRRSFGASSAT